MIKFNEKYNLNQDKGEIFFSEGKKGTINANYTFFEHQKNGVINGILEEQVLKGTYHIDNSVGLIEITFFEKGFDAKWKQGIEPGPMKGKWEGQLTSSYESIKSLPKNDLESAIENVSELDIYIRYSDGDQEVGYFSINIKSELKLPNEISYESLTNLISYDGLFGDENFLNAVKYEVSEFSLKMSDCPQIFITKINDLDLKPLYDFHFNCEENEDIVATLMNINSDEVSDFLSDYFNDTVYSIENLF